MGGHPADFTHHDPLSSINMGGPSEAADCHRHPELKRKVYSALQECDEGELSIAIPAEVSLKSSGHSSGFNYTNDGASYAFPGLFLVKITWLYQSPLRNPKLQAVFQRRPPPRNSPLSSSISPTAFVTPLMDWSLSFLVIHTL